MGSTPEKVDRIIARDTQTTWPDPWSLVETDYSLNCFGKVEASTKALGSVIIDCGDKHYNKGFTLGYLYV